MKQTLILDSSQISTFCECSQKWEYQQQEQLVRLNLANPELSNRPSEAIAAGSLGHKYLELYYLNNGCVARALEFNPDASDTVDENFPLDSNLRKLVRRRFEDYVLFWGSHDYIPATQTKTRIEVRNGMLTDVYYHIPLVEQGFSYPLLDTSEYLFVLEGRIDFIGRAGSEHIWMDHKFQFRERQLYSKSIQFRNYSLVTGFPLGVINYVRLTKDVGPKTFIRQPISFGPYEMRCWREELIEIFVTAARLIAAGNWEIPQTRNRKSCEGQFGYECEFTTLCNEYNPETRNALKTQTYTRRKEWKPW